MPVLRNSKTGFKWLLALCSFLGAIFGASLALVRLGSRPEGEPREQAHSQDASEVFYHRLGAAPLGYADGGAKTGTPQSYTLEIQLKNRSDEAEALIDELKSKGVDAYYTPLARGGQVVYRVRHGVYNDAELAKAAQAQLFQLNKVPSRVVKLQ